ncbi:MAG: hypothetical protein ACFFGZ_08640 [Candidatus Thorarchaeota archaeon]
MPDVKTYDLTLGIGVGLVLVAAVLTLIEFTGLFALIAPVLVLVGAGFLAYSFYMGRESKAAYDETPSDTALNEK